MQTKRSRLALLGMFALVLTMAAGMTAGVADAQKKGKKKGKKGGGQVTVTAPATTIPPAAGGIGSLTDIPLRVGKKAKGKVVANGSVEVTGSFSGPAGFADDIEVELVGPGGLAIDLAFPFDDETGLVGPLTWTPHSYFFLCPSLLVVATPCNNPKHSIMRPYIGDVSTPLLALYYGLPAPGLWHLLVVNTGPNIVQLALARLVIELTRPQIVE